MIPKLYESNETEFKTNGLGSLSDAISCKVTEERNGAFELEMEYPVGGLHYDLIESNRIIYAKPNETSDPQPFDIKEVTLSMDGMKATIYAQHMRYRLNGVPVKPFSATGITNALQGLVDNSLIKMGFTVWTDINNSSSKFELKEPNTFGQLLGGTDGSILDVFSGSSGCEYEFDKKAIKLWAHRGSDNGVTIRYGKNLKGCKMETNIESVYTGVLAYWTKEDDGSTTSIQGDIQYIDNHDKYPREQIYLLDCSSDYTEQPSTSELNAKAKAYGTNNNIGEPSVSADVEFYQLWQTEEYKNVAPLERVSLCDTVHVIFRELGCDVSAIVNKTVYDTLAERYDSISIGSAKSKLGDTVKQTAHDEAEEIRKDTVSVVQNSIDNAVNKIRGGTDGHVVLATNANGETNELYAYDGESLSSASKVMRVNYEGLAGTDEGLNGTYKVAITTDGHINADQITFGTMDGGLIKANTIVVGSLSEDVQSDISKGQTALDETNKINSNVNALSNDISNITQKQETLESDVQKAQSDAENANSEAKKAQEEAQIAVTKSEEANTLATSAYNGLNDLEQVVQIDSSGVKVLEKANSKNYSQIKSDGMHVFNNGEDVAQFGQQSKMNNLAVKDFFMFGAHRAETLTVDGEVGTAFYWIGDVE